MPDEQKKPKPENEKHKVNAPGKYDLNPKREKKDKPAKPEA